ncbi:MAG: YbbR-like domain-containing protein [Kiritimatiellia bacterium]|jgi:hypothetical protein
MRKLTSWLISRANALVVRTQQFMRRHLGPSGDLKALSLLVAAVIYYFIQNLISFSGTYTVPVLVSVREAHVAVRSQSDDEVKVTLKGSEAEVRAFDPANLAVRLKLSHVEAGTERQKVKLRASDVEGFGKLRVVRIEPEVISVEFDNEIEQRLPLALPTLTGHPLQGEASVELMRKHVTVRGPKSRLQKLVDDRIMIPTDPIDVAGKTQGFTKAVKIRPPVDSGISVVLPDEVEAKVEILNIPGPEQSLIDVLPGGETNSPAISPPSSALTNFPALNATNGLPALEP